MLAIHLLHCLLRSALSFLISPALSACSKDKAPFDAHAQMVCMHTHACSPPCPLSACCAPSLSQLGVVEAVHVLARLACSCGRTHAPRQRYLCASHASLPFTTKHTPLHSQPLRLRVPRSRSARSSHSCRRRCWRPATHVSAGRDSHRSLLRGNCCSVCAYKLVSGMNCACCIVTSLQSRRSCLWRWFKPCNRLVFLVCISGQTYTDQHGCTEPAAPCLPCAVNPFPAAEHKRSLSERIGLDEKQISVGAKMTTCARVYVLAFIVPSPVL